MKSKRSGTLTVGGEAAADRRGLTVRVIHTGEQKRFDELLDAKHYLGQTRRIGDFLRQVVERDGEWIGLLAWGPASLHLKDRDKWIGWDRLRRAERLKLVAQNRRYLLLVDRGAEPNLASQVLALAVRALPDQWDKQFGYRPVLAETFTNIEMFHGTCYKASGWEPIGMSAGYSRHRVDFYKRNDCPKKLWMKELVPDARAILCSGRLAEEHSEAITPASSGVLPIDVPQMRSLMDAFLAMKDPRGRNTRFKLPQVLVLIAMALLAGKRDIAEFHRFGWRLRQDQRAMIRLPFKKGSRKIREIPTYNVYYQVLSRIDLDRFAKVLSEWLREKAGSLPGALALDGKMIRESIGVVTLADHDTGTPHSMAVISQKEGEVGRAEMPVGEDLVRKSGDLAGKVITADALHAQRNTSREIVEHGGEYILQIKANQKKTLNHAAATSAGVSPLLP